MAIVFAMVLAGQLLGQSGRWLDLLWASLALGLAGLAINRACTPPETSAPHRLIRIERDRLIVGLPPDGRRLRDWLCGEAWLDWRAVPIVDIQALRLTPGYLAIYLKPSLAAVDVFFAERDTARVHAILSPLAHLMVEEVPR